MPRYPRKKTRQIMVGSVPVGGDAPVTVQSMTTTKTADVEATLAQVYALAAAGADIVRCTCNEREAAEGLAHIVPRSPVPIVADIHFHVEMALAAIEAGVDCLRLNPGNLRKPEEIKLVASECKDRGIPVRIGVNAGSLDKRLYEKHGGATPEALVESALIELGLFAEVDFDNVKISVKASRVPIMVEAYRQLSEQVDHPLHLGLTEAGPPPAGIIKGTAGIGTLLMEGIGDTIRYSLTTDPVEEAKAGRSLLESLGLRERRNVDLIACPSCGRAEIDVYKVAQEAQAALENRGDPAPGRSYGVRGKRPRRSPFRRPRDRGRKAPGAPVHPGRDHKGSARGRNGVSSRRGSRKTGQGGLRRPPGCCRPWRRGRGRG